MNEQALKAKAIIENYSGPELRIMEVCGTHTHEIFRMGIRSILPENVNLISGPGCPVCVTPVGFIDEALMLALEKNVTICTFGDLVRVPGSETSLAGARSQGARVQVVYSPLDAYELARDNPDEQVCFLAVGFETTTPAACIAVDKARENGVDNFTLLTANKTMVNAYRALKGSADAFLYPGHVNAITGTSACEKLAEEGIYGVVAGFTASELLTAIAVTITRLTEGKPFFENCYPRVVTREGSVKGMQLMEKVMEPCDAEWRGLGVIPASGLRLNDEYRDFDARFRFDIPEIRGKGNPACRCGDVLQGKCRPSDCPLFGKVCTPQHAVGSCMVSNEGTCSAYYQYDFILQQARQQAANK